MWHRDDFGFKNLDLFLAITNIDDDNGPLITLKKDPLKIFYRISKEVNSNLWRKRKISDENFDYLDSKKHDFCKIKGSPWNCHIN